MRALPSLIASSFLFALAAAACSSNDGAAAGVSPGDAGSDAPVVTHDDSGSPDDAGGGDAAKPPDAGFTGPTTPLPAMATQIAGALCDYFQRCFPAYIDEYMGSLAACKSGEAVAQQGQYPAGSLFSKAAVDASAACFASTSCDSLYGYTIQTTCAIPRPVNGGAVGAQCATSDGCASNLCTGSTPTTCGSCAASVTVKVGDACSPETGKICPAGSSCLGKCVAQQGLNAPCNGTATTGTLVCGAGLTCTAGTCVKAGAAAAACTASADCDTFQLAVCDKIAGVCKTLQFLDLDAPCSSTDRLHECGKGLRCIKPAGATDGTCQAAVQPGGACTTSNNCVFGYNCRNDVCVGAGSDRPVCK
jgi:hypothetical protein